MYIPVANQRIRRTPSTWCKAIVYFGEYPLSLYNDTVLDHYQNPRNVGALEGADAVGIAENSACGDVLHLYLQIRDGHVTAASFKTFGCAAAIAAGSMLTEMVKGSSIEEICKYTKQDVVDALGGLPPMKVHCSVLAEDAIKAAIEDLNLRSR
jgi:nitrogen fixation NifU-like protein